MMGITMPPDTSMVQPTTWGLHNASEVEAGVQNGPSHEKQGICKVLDG